MNWRDCSSFWPNADASRFADVAPHRWHLQDSGHGRCVLLLHGAGASTHTWRDVLPRLAFGHRVVAIDLPGQGFTGLGDPARCGLEAMSEDIATLLEAEGIAPDVIVGHSAGAAIAVRLALDLPRPPGAVVAINGALGGFRGPAGEVFPALARILAKSPLPALGFSWFASSPSSVRRLIAGTGSRLDARGIELYRRLLSDRGHVAATLAMMAQWDLSGLLADLPKLATPMLFLVGDRDLAVLPETSRRAARAVPEGRVEVFPGRGHLLHEEQPAAVAVAIRAFGAGRTRYAGPNPREVSSWGSMPCPTS